MLYLEIYHILSFYSSTFQRRGFAPYTFFFLQANLMEAPMKIFLLWWTIFTLGFSIIKDKLTLLWQGWSPQIVESCHPGWENMEYVWRIWITWKRYKTSNRCKKKSALKQRTENTRFIIQNTIFKTQNIWFVNQMTETTIIYKMAFMATVEKVIANAIVQHDSGSAQDRRTSSDWWRPGLK